MAKPSLDEYLEALWSALEMRMGYSDQEKPLVREKLFTSRRDFDLVADGGVESLDWMDIAFHLRKSLGLEMDDLPHLQGSTAGNLYDALFPDAT